MIVVDMVQIYREAIDGLCDTLIPGRTILVSVLFWYMTEDQKTY